MRRSNIRPLSAKALSLAIISIAAITSIGCGQKYEGAKDELASNATELSNNPGSAPSAPTTGSSAATAGTGTAPISIPIGGIGYSSQSYTVQAKSILKIKFTPGVQNGTVYGSNYSPQYSAMGVYIQVGDTSLPTDFVRNGISGTAQTSRALDFSGAFQKSCAADDTGCRETVIITVKQPNYDHFCYTYGQYCQWTHVYETHPWNGTLTIQTDDTDAI